MIKKVATAETIEITLMPNRSLTTKQTQWVVFGVSSFIFLIALFWSMFGAFLVLPFAGLDIALFAYFMFKINERGLQKQVVTIDPQQVRIQSGKTTIEQTLTLPREDTVVVVAHPEASQPLGLTLSDSERHFELGEFLTLEEKRQTRTVLKEAGLREINQQWWHA